MVTARRPLGYVVGLLLVSSLATGQPSDSKRRENLATCLSGRYPSLCDHSMLAPDVLKKALDSEAQTAGTLIASLPAPSASNLPSHLGQNVNTVA